MCVCMCLCVIRCECRCSCRPEEGVRSLEARVTGSCELLDVGAWNRTQVSGTDSQPLNYLSSLCFESLKTAILSLITASCKKFEIWSLTCSCCQSCYLLPQLLALMNAFFWNRKFKETHPLMNCLGCGIYHSNS